MNKVYRWLPPSHYLTAVLVVLIAVGAVLGLQVLKIAYPQSPAPVARPVPPKVVAWAAPPKTVQSKVTVAPSAFANEQQMSSTQLMKRWAADITAASKRFDVPQAWIRAVMQIESGGRTTLGENAPITSSAGAMGLMQIMPSTYEDMRQQHGLGADPYDPHDNIQAGAAYLRWLAGKYPYPALFAAYNNGPGNLEERLVHGGLMPAETRDYVIGIRQSLQTGDGPLHWKKAKLTQPNGVAIWIDGAGGGTVRAALPDEYGPGVQSVVTVGRVRQGVRESVSQVRAILAGHRGKK